MGQHTIVTVAGFLQSHLERRPVPDLKALGSLSVVGKSRALVAACQVRLETGGQLPCYLPDADVIVMPSPLFYCVSRLWKRPKRYAIDILHELIHATGHASRLARARHVHFGDPIYQREELVAELGSALLMHDLGFKGRPILPHAKYLRGWLEGLSNPTIELDMALARANQAAGFAIAVARHNLQMRLSN